MSQQDMSGSTHAGASADMNSRSMNSDRSMDKSNSTDKSSAMDKSRAMDNGRAMTRSSDMNAQASAPKAKPHRVARANEHNRGNDAQENQETAQLNRQQVADNGMRGGMSSSGMNSSGIGTSRVRSSGMSANGNAFDKGSPQQAQAGGANCTPDRPDCGTARQNPAIQSSPQQRTYNAAPQ